MQEDQLTVDGHTLRELAGQAGQTPFFVYSRRLVDARVAEVRKLLPAGVHLHYAVKANPLPALVRHIAPRWTDSTWPREVNWRWP